MGPSSSDYKSDNLQYNTMGRWVAETIVSLTKHLMFQVSFFHDFLENSWPATLSYFSSINIILGPSNAWLMRQSTQQPCVLYWILLDFTYNKCIAISAKSFYNFLFFLFFPFSTPILCWLLRKYKLSRKISLIFSPGILLPKLFWPTVKKICSSDGGKLILCHWFQFWHQK